MWRNWPLIVPLKPEIGTGDHYLLYLSLCEGMTPSVYPWNLNQDTRVWGPLPAVSLYVKEWVPLCTPETWTRTPGFWDHYLLYLSMWWNGSLCVPLKPEPGHQGLETITCCISLCEGITPSVYPWNLNQDTRVWGPLPVVSLYVKEWLPLCTPET